MDNKGAVVEENITAARRGQRPGVIYPHFADKFFRIDFEAMPMPVLCLYPIPAPLDLEEVRLEICGLEEHPRSIPWKTAGQLPRVKLAAPLICQIFNWSEGVEWEGVRLVDVLDYFKVETTPDGYYAFYSRDGIFFETLSRDEARDPRVLLAYGLNGSPLPLAHGGPLRLVVPFLQGYKSVKWIGSIRAYRHDPIGIKRLMGQSPSGHLNEEWKKRYQIDLPSGKAGDPPAVAAPSSMASVEPGPPSKNSPPAVRAEAAAKPPAVKKSPAGMLTEIIAILRPNKREETVQALEEAGIYSYTTCAILGRGQQRGLKFPGADGEPASIKFLPKQMFQIVVESHDAGRAIDSIIKANRTGKGEYGDGKIFVLNMEDAVRVSTADRGVEAL